MTTTANSPRPKLPEILIGVSAIFWGSVVAFWPEGGGLSWTGITGPLDRAVGATATLAWATVWAGCRTNGRWRWSPVLRLAGLLVALALTMWLTYAAWRAQASSAFENELAAVIGDGEGSA